MSVAVHPVLDLLCKASRLECDARTAVFSMLRIGVNSPVVCILNGSDSTRLYEQHQELLNEVCLIVAGHKTEQSITDWPFEIFWGNPRESRHSKLLAYFIDPEKDHRCGQYLLTAFLKVLEQAVNKAGRVAHCFRSDKCSVVAESEYIDLLIKREGEDGRFAIIIENKVNWAVDQKQQLQTYVERVHQQHKFAYHEIYVFYLPLTGDKHPNPSDREWVVKSGTHYRQITFEDEIQRWLDAALQDSDFECRDGMRDNLTHYRNLIRYLARQQKKLQMSAKIIEQLREAESTNKLPTLADVKTITQSLDSLRQCLERVLRGKLLLAVKDSLQQRGCDVWMCLEKAPGQKVEISDRFDTAFAEPMNVCLSVTDAVRVCFGGGGSHTFWLGYLRDGSSQEQANISSAIVDEAKKQLGQKITTSDSAWFAWAYRDGVYDETGVENCVLAISNKLVELRTCLRQRLHQSGAKP